MAADTSHKTEKTDTSSDRLVQRTHGLLQPQRWQGSQYSSGPFGLMRQMQDEIDHWFTRMGVDRSWMSPSNWFSGTGQQSGDWMPAVDAFQRGNDFVIRADVPGMARHDLSVEVGDDAVTIRGERKHEEQHEDRDGMYWSERSHGSFYRTVPLPPGAISDSAKATFNNGVLEVVLQAPSPEARRGRKIDISGRDEKNEKKTA
jgi:HSP20 family protein